MPVGNEVVFRSGQKGIMIKDMIKNALHHNITRNYEK